MSSGQQPILVLAETGFIIRNLLLGYFAGEVSKSRKLLVAVKNPNDSMLLDLIKEHSIELIDFPLENPEDKRTVAQKLLSWDNSIYNLKMVVKDNASIRYQTRLYEVSGTWKQKAVNKAFQKVARVVKTVGLSGAIEDAYLENFVGQKEITQKWAEILKKYNPCLVFSSMLTLSTRYRCSSDLPVLVAAKKLGIRSCTLVQSWDNLSSKTSVLPPWLDMYYTWSQTMSEELLQYNPRIDKKKVKIVGSPQYDFHLKKELLEERAVYLNKIGLDPKRQYILVGTGTAKWMPDEMEKMIALCKAIHQNMPDIQCLIRLHPKDHGERWQPYLDTLKENRIVLQYTSPQKHMDSGGFIPPRDFYRDQINTIYHSEIIINSSSSITVDAAIFDKPVICIAYDRKPDKVFPEGRALTYSRSAHYSKLTETGGVKVVYSEQACIEAIKEYLKNPALHRAERKKIVSTVTADINEIAGLRLAEEVIALADKATIKDNRKTLVNV